MDATSSLERELKLSAPPGFRMPRFAGLAPGLRAAAEDEHTATAVYWDTEDLRLTRWDTGLRYRSSDGWTLKLGDEGVGAAVVRREFHIAGNRGAPPPAALDLVQAITRGRALAPVARLRTRRRAVRICDDNGRWVAEVTSDDVRVLEGDETRSRFHEVEVELGSGCPPEVVEAILERLRRAGVGPPHRVAKHVRALGLESGVVPEVSVAAPGPDASGGEVLQQTLARSVAVLVRRDAGVRVDESIHDVHQMRVATRRLRSCLGTFGRLVDGEWAAELTHGLKELGASLGRVRDADVRKERLQRGIDELPQAGRGPAKELLERVDRQRAVDLERLLVRLRSARYLELVDRLIEAARHPRLRGRAQGPAARVLPRPVRRRWRRLARAKKALSADPGAAALHRVRIRAKHLRYAAEALEPVFGPDARRLARAAKGVQSVLGDHRDAEETAAWLRSVGGQGSPEAAVAAQALATRECELAREMLALWPAGWRRASERGSGRVAAPRVPRGQARGSVKRKLEPSPTRLSTVISPPRLWTRCFTIARPSPVPPWARERALSTR